MNNCEFITLTNYGYLEYTKNALQSLKNINFNGILNCYCLDKKGYEELSKIHSNTHLLKGASNRTSDKQIYRKGDWKWVVFQKFYMIYQSLQKNEYVLCTDGDIVYENRNFLRYSLDNIEDNELLIQNDCNPKNHDGKIVESARCSGYMLIKSNENTLKLFNPENITVPPNTTYWGDQSYINGLINKKKIKHKVLNLELFPNGGAFNFYKNTGVNISPYLIHFNWLQGDRKKKCMKSNGKWFDEQ